ncbi:MAG: hypothetical protein ACON38_05215 [Akkermansiaceae bacterium]
MNSPSKLASLGDEFWSLGLEELESLQEVLAKIIEAKQAMEGVSEKIGQRQDRETSDDLRIIRHFLDNPDLELTGPECVLLGAFFKYRENIELLDTRALNVTLDSYGRKPSNTTSTIENLEKKGLMKFVTGEDLHAHKTFRLTESGLNEVRDLIGRLKRKNFSAVG